MRIYSRWATRCQARWITPANTTEMASSVSPRQSVKQKLVLLLLSYWKTLAIFMYHRVCRRRRFRVPERTVRQDHTWLLPATRFSPYAAAEKRFHFRRGKLQVVATALYSHATFDGENYALECPVTQPFCRTHQESNDCVVRMFQQCTRPSSTVKDIVRGLLGAIMNETKCRNNNIHASNDGGSRDTRSIVFLLCMALHSFACSIAATF